jgi:hypothetical protein
MFLHKGSILALSASFSDSSSYKMQQYPHVGHLCQNANSGCGTIIAMLQFVQTFTMTLSQIFKLWQD